MGAPPISKKTFSNTQIPVTRTTTGEVKQQQVPVAADEAKKGWAAKPTTSRSELPAVTSNVMLATKASQMNPVSSAAGNSDRVCGGAVVVSALLLRSGTPAAMKANAKALEGAFDAAGAAKLLPASVKEADVKAAFERFAAGTTTPGDVNVLQQAAYALGRSYSPAADDGLDTSQMAAMVANLKARGAALGPETRFVQVHDGEGGGGHWVVKTPEALVNPSPVAKVSADDIAVASGKFSGDVTVRKDGKVELRTRVLSADEPPAWEGGGWKMVLDPKSPPYGAQLRTQRAKLAKMPEDFE
ncbi:MAG: hypothetical protein JNK82_27845 [Myxococcaceae bacterium]|nr:hypothetical protein [Myxococcaceae bacterium]